MENFWIVSAFYGENDERNKDRHFSTLLEANFFVNAVIDIQMEKKMYGDLVLTVKDARGKIYHTHNLWKNTKMFGTAYANRKNSLNTIFASMIAGKYTSVIDPKGRVYAGLVNGIMREDGSGRNWIVTITNKTTSERVFIHAT